MEKNKKSEKTKSNPGRMSQEEVHAMLNKHSLEKMEADLKK